MKTPYQITVPPLILSMTLLLALAWTTTRAFAISPPTASVIDTEESLTGSVTSLKSHFEYRIANRADPFMPFITEKASSANINAIIPVAERLTGMQLFEPGQLSLVAIVVEGNNDFAMAEDTTGKGYVLNTGMKIGKRGTITAIMSNQVVIEETAYTRAGKKLTSTIVMLLKKEGEE